MKRFATILLSALVSLSLVQMPAAAQSRGGGGNSSRRTGSMSSQPSRSSSQTRQQPQSVQQRQQGRAQSSSLQSYSRSGSQTQRQSVQQPSRSRQVPQSQRQNPVQARPQGQPVRSGMQTQSAMPQSQIRRQHGGTVAPGVPQRVPAGHAVNRIAPRDRRPMPYDRPDRFWHHGHHYYGHRVTFLPSWHVRRVYGGITYYIVDDIYYRYHLGHYYVCRPPFGIFVDMLDDMAFAACTFSYYNSVNNAYRIMDENARTISGQNALIAENNALLAQQNAELAMNQDRAAASYEEADEMGLVQSYASAAEEYFYQDGVFYSKTADGRYVTIVPPAGALVQELPDDYDVVEMDGKEYYKVDDTVFKTSVIDGKIYFEVLGQFTGELAAKYNLYEK